MPTPDNILPNLSVSTLAHAWMELQAGLVICSRTMYVYNQRGVWIPLREDAARSSIQSMDGKFYGRSKVPDQLKTLRMNPIYRNQVYDFILHHEPIRNDKFFSEAPAGIAVKNGFLDVSPYGVTLKPHSPDNRATIAIDVVYDPKAKPTKFLKLLEGILPGQSAEQDLIRDFYGTALLGLSTHYQRCLVLLGAGANGKSTLMETLEEALFDVSERGKVEPGRWDHEYYIMELFGKKLNSIPELPTGEMLASEKFKAVVAGDEVMGRRPTEKPTIFRPRAAHVFAVNELPDTSDVTEGFWRRFLMVPLKEKFTGQDTKESIKGTILALERPGILNWAIFGAQKVMERGNFILPPSHDQTKLDWQTHADPVRGFIDACCDYTTTPSTPMGTLYDHYKDWCRLTNRKQARNTVLGRRLKQIQQVTSKHTSGGTSYNLRVKDPQEWKDIKTDFYRPKVYDIQETPNKVTKVN